MKIILLIPFFLILIKPVFSQESLITIPKVQQWAYSEKKTNYNSVTIQYQGVQNVDQRLLLERFERELAEIGTPILKKSSPTSIDISFNPTYIDIEEGEDSYEIQLSKRTKVSSSSYNGLVYATRTLLQIFSQERYRKQIPNGLILDYPSYKKRMLLIDVARKFFTVEEIKDFIRAMAWVKMNELHLHLSDNSWGGYSAYRLESEKYPELTAKDGYYSWDEIRSLQDFAKSYGISIVPEIDSPGHSLAFTNIRPDLKSTWLTPNYLDITNKDTYTFMEEILAEVIPQFDAPDFHLGTDEYRINSIKDDSLKNVIGETFRGYINYFNRVVREHGKNTRIWSGFEHMPGKTQIDDNIIIDMWETSDAKDKSDRGFKIINSSHYYTYIVPGAPYYGVDDKFVYEQWTPEIFSNVSEQNLKKGSPGLLGSKMHIWNDFGPTGYSTEEIARLSIPSLMVFSEKMWGTQAYDSLADFKNSLDGLMQIPHITFLDRNFAKQKTLYISDEVLDLEDLSLITLNSEKKNAEYPWKLELTLMRTGDAFGKDVLISSRLATIYADLEHTYKYRKNKKQIEETKRGFAIVRANQTEGDTPLDSHRPNVVVFNYELPLNKLVEISLLGEKGKISMYADGKHIGTENIQMLCPLEFVGSEKEGTFKGQIKKARIMELQN